METRIPVRGIATRVALVCALVVSGLVVAGPGPQHGDRPGTEGEHGGHGHDSHDATTDHRFDDVDRWVERFDDPERDAWQRPDEVVRFLDLRPGDTVADLGAGTGYFSVRLARALGEGGRVLAVDVEPALVEHMRARAEREGLTAVMEPRLAARDDPGLPAEEVDRILIVNTWHHIDDRLDYLERLARALAPGGRVVVVDYREGDLPVGPPEGHKLSEEHVRSEFAEAGWTLQRAPDLLPYQYVLEFRP